MALHPQPLHRVNLLPATAMKRTPLIALTAVLGAATLLLAATGENPLTKPKEPHPEPLKALEKDPNYKRAPLFIQPQSVTDDRKTQPPGTNDNERTAFGWHKNAMHLKAVKRSGQDNPHLGATIKELSETLKFDANGKPEVDPVTGAKVMIPIPEPESAFEDVPVNGATLKVFRFTNLREFINDGDSKPNGEGTLAARKKALAAAIALGKAFFWDPRFSSDGKVACATCHYAAGTDHRTKGVVSLPANMKIHAPWPNPNRTSGYEPYELTSSDLVSGSPEIEGIAARGLFDPASITGFQLREVIGSLGVQRRYFNPVTDGGAKPSDSENTVPQATAAGQEKLGCLLSGLHNLESTYRQVTPRNAGTVVNAVFNSRNFHDSRANMVFNGHTGFGQHTDDLVNDYLFVLRSNGNKLKKIFTWNPSQPTKPNEPGERNPYYIANASLASQAVEPILSDVEMSSVGRMFHHIADRMLEKKILEGQTISETDSSLGNYAGGKDKGGNKTYASLIKEAFDPAWWKSDVKVALPKGPVVNQAGNRALDFKKEDLGEYSLMEANFGLFWGLAIHLYESTLISEESPFDHEQAGVKSSERTKATTAISLNGADLRAKQPLTAAARRGFHLFSTIGCADCHAGAEFSAASISEIGLLAARGENAAGVQLDNLIPSGLFDPIKPPPFVGEEDEVVAGVLLCPAEKPLGVECMALNGRFESVYDGGNYNVGVSRFMRTPGWPESPPVAGSSNLKKWFYPPGTLLWDDSGNGNGFLPVEANLPPNTALTSVARRAFGAHVMDVNSTRLAALIRLLGISCPDAPTVATSDTKNLLASLEMNAAEVNQLLVQDALGNRNAGIQLESLGKLLDKKAVAEPDKATGLVKAKNALQSIRTRVGEVAAAIGKDVGPALNYTQQVKKLTPVLKAVRDQTAQDNEAPPSPALSAQLLQAAEDRNVAKIEFAGSNSSTVRLVTPATPVPPPSLARRWFERLTSFILEAQAKLKEAQNAGDAAAVAHYTQVVDALRRLASKYERVADAGAFKAPTLRNVELTGPYMHNGSLLTLEAVVEFYSRGGDYNRRVRANEDDVKTGDQHPEMAPLNLSTEQKADLVAFLKSLTDERVRYQKAPFDHPSLHIPLTPENPSAPVTSELPAVGRGGLNPGDKNITHSFERQLGGR